MILPSAPQLSIRSVRRKDECPLNSWRARQLSIRYLWRSCKQTSDQTRFSPNTSSTILGPTPCVSLGQPSTDMYCRRSRPLNKRPATTDLVSYSESLTRPRDRNCFNSCLETYPHTHAVLRSFSCRMANCTCYPLAR